MIDTKYNGWTNYETWLVNLWIDNDGTSESIRETCADMYETKADFDESDFASVIREYVEELYLADIPPSGMVADLVGAAMREVNWHEIAGYYADDLPEAEPEESDDE